MVAFASTAAALVSGDGNNNYDVFVKDLNTGKTTLVSRDSGGTQGNGESLNPAISVDGRSVTFESAATNLVLNPGFETAGSSAADAANWTEGANHTRASDKFHTGGWSLRSTFRGAGTDTLVRIENLRGSGFNDTLTGDGLTREELAEAVARYTGRPHLREKLLGGWGTLLKPGAYQGHLVFGPSSGQNVTFVSPRHWLGEFPELDTANARLEILRRYLSAYGPPTPNDFASWWGAAKADARKLFKALGDELIPVSVDGRDAWALQTDAETLQAAQPSKTIRLLPSFDPYTLGLRRDCESALPAAHKGRVFRQQGWISAVVLVGGYVVGVWNHEIRKARVTVTVEPFEPLSPAVRAGIAREAARLGAYFNAEPEVRFAD
jgi:hypothetical protein